MSAALLLLALAAAADPGPAVRVSATPAKTEVTVGEPFAVEVVASGPAGTSYVFPAEAGDTVLATMTLDNPAGPGIVVAVKQPGAGCTAYLGPIYLGSTGNYPDVPDNLRFGYPDQLLEQAASWAATCFAAPVAQAIPTLSEAGAAALVVTLVLAGVVLLRRRSRLDRAGSPRPPWAGRRRRRERRARRVHRRRRRSGPGRRSCRR